LREGLSSKGCGAMLFCLGIRNIAQFYQLRRLTFLLILEESLYISGGICQ